LMTTEVVRLPADATAHDAIALLRRLGPDAETIYYLYIVNDAGQLEGTVSLRSLITSSADTAVGTLARGQPRTVSVNDDQQYVAEMIARYNLLALPVVDGEGVLKGIVTVDDVIDVLREEAFEDISLMSSGAGASDEGIPPAFGAARLGWLLLALAVSMVIGIVALHLPAAERGGVAAFALYLPLLIDLPISLSFRISSAASRRFEPGADSNAERALVREIEAGALTALLASAAVFFCSLLTSAF